MHLIQIRCPIRSNIKLRAISIFLPQIRHAKHILPVVCEAKALIFEGRTIYRLPASAVILDYVASLYAKTWHNPMEFTSFKVKRLSLSALTLLSGTQAKEVITRLLHFIVQPEYNRPNLLAIDLNIKERPRKLLLGIPPPRMVSMLMALSFIPYVMLVTHIRNIFPLLIQYMCPPELLCSTSSSVSTTSS